MVTEQRAKMVDVSIVIPTYNRKAFLLETLASLTKQSYPATKLEVIVVDDGSTDGTHEIASEQFPFLLRYIYQSNQGSAAARNTGGRNASGKLLIFLDDDMWIEPEYVMGLVEDHQHHSHIVGMGSLRPFLPDAPSIFAKINTEITEHTKIGSNVGFVDFTECVTNNLSVERDDFFEIGMMQDVAGDGPTWWGDVDFGYRAAQKGFRFLRSDKAICVHRDYSCQDLTVASIRAYNIARLAVPLFHKHPKLFPRIPMFHDKSPISWRQDSSGSIVRKLIRHIASSRLILSVMRQSVNLLEKYYPSTSCLGPLYRWILGGCHYQGFRDGLREFGPLLDEEQDILIR